MINAQRPGHLPHSILGHSCLPLIIHHPSSIIPFISFSPFRPGLPFLELLCTLSGGFVTMNIDKKEQLTHEAQAVAEAESDGQASSGTIASEALEEHRLTAEEIEQLKEQAQKASEHWEQMLRVAADFENFKKRAARERQEISKYANESLLQKLIPVLDNLDMELASASS